MEEAEDEQYYADRTMGWNAARSGLVVSQRDARLAVVFFFDWIFDDRDPSPDFGYRLFRDKCSLRRSFQAFHRSRC